MGATSAGTLYPNENGYEAHTRQNIYEFMHQRLGVPRDECKEVHAKLFAQTNQTLKALRDVGGYQFDREECAPQPTLRCLRCLYTITYSRPRVHKSLLPVCPHMLGSIVLHQRACSPEHAHLCCSNTDTLFDGVCAHVCCSHVLLTDWHILDGVCCGLQRACVCCRYFAFTRAGCEQFLTPVRRHS